MSSKNHQLLATMDYDDLLQHWVTTYVDKLSREQLDQMASRDPNASKFLQHAFRVWQEVKRRSKQRARPLLQ